MSEVPGSDPIKALNFSKLLYAIAKISFITSRIIAALDFISAVHYMIHFIYLLIVDSFLT